MSEPRTFPSRVDRWLAILMIVAMGGSLVVSLLSFIPGPPAAAAFATAICALTSGFVLMLFITTRYVVDDESLIARSGPFRWRIPLREIAEVRPTRNPLSSPALSLDRLDVKYGRGKSLLISPEDKPGFLAELAAREPGLKVEAGRIARRTPGEPPCP